MNAAPCSLAMPRLNWVTGAITYKLDDENTIGVNGGMYYGADAPFGGYKNSGVGRQCGIEGFAQYTETKTIGWRLPRQG